MILNSPLENINEDDKKNVNKSTKCEFYIILLLAYNIICIVLLYM